MNSVGMRASGHASSPITSSDKNIMAKVNHRDIIRKRRHSCFEWTQLIATICIPVIIAIYTFVENNNNELIAAANRHKDIEIANMSRKSEFEIAQANRLNEITIAEQSRQKDRDLANDQQQENILVEYHTFLANLLIDNGMALNNSSAMAKTVAKFMTLTALNQLDMRRKSRLVRSLYDAKLITLKRNSKPDDASILQLGHVDLSDITLGSLRNSPDELPQYRYIDWHYLWLPSAILTNASFRHTSLDCATFSTAQMNSVDLSFAAHYFLECFGDIRQSQTDFASASLVNANLNKARFHFTDFYHANLTFADIRGFRCVECNFSSAQLFQANLSFSGILHSFVLSQERLVFDHTNFRQAVIHSASFRTISFSKSDWSNVQASQMRLQNCTFTDAIMENCSFVKSEIRNSVFRNASLFSIDLSAAVLHNVSFVNSNMTNANMSSTKCDHCDFTNVMLQSAVLKNASLRYSDFLNCHVSASQLQETIDLSGSRLPNGTFVKSND